MLGVLVCGLKLCQNLRIERGQLWG
uniref:Uncharacterized protein n=1 Tax=Anguilla anguilla TaxID=7936 RepID=A0A0E9XUZ8_ANGAN